MGKKSRRRSTGADAPGAVATLPRFPTRDLAQVTADMIAWQDTGWSRDPMALPAVYASVRLIASTINQLPIEVEPGEAPPWLLSPRRYDSQLDLNDTIQHIVTAMALRGAGYLQCVRVGGSWAIDALHPSSVQAVASTSGIVALDFLVNGEPMERVPVVQDRWAEGRRYILHIPYLVTPDHPEGLSPVAAARQSLEGYQGVERQASTLLDGGTYSGGRLESEQDITEATALRYQETWVANRKVGNLPVLGAGLRYVNDLINPTDAQWLESRQFNSQQIAMMFGIPPDYLGMTSSGGSSSLSYANSQDNDRRFRRNCLAAFTQQISDAFSTLLQVQQRVVFDYTRWEGETGADDAGGAQMDDQGQRGRDADDRGPRGPVAGAHPVRRDVGVVRAGGDRPAAGGGRPDAVEPRPVGADRAHPEGGGLPGGPEGGGGDPADEQGPRRDPAAGRRFRLWPFGGVRTDRDEAREGRPDVHEGAPARTVPDPAARVPAGGGNSNQE